MSSNTEAMTPDYSALADRIAEERLAVTKWEGADSMRAARLVVRECAARLISAYPDTDSFEVNLSEDGQVVDSIGVRLLSPGSASRSDMTVMRTCQRGVLGELVDLLSKAVEHRDDWGIDRPGEDDEEIVDIYCALAATSPYLLQAGFHPEYFDRPATPDDVVQLCRDWGFWNVDLEEAELSFYGNFETSIEIDIAGADTLREVASKVADQLATFDPEEDVRKICVEGREELSSTLYWMRNSTLSARQFSEASHAIRIALAK